MSDRTILVCACGKRLRAPGAIPGRVGRCPACGGELRVPEDQEQARSPAPPPPRSKRPRKRSPAPETEIWDGFVKAPERLETRVSESLLYPLWGANGIAFLVLWPPLLWFLTLPFLTAYFALSTAVNTRGLGTLFLALPASLGLIVVFGYGLLFLARVAASSAVGERHHPRWPDWELSSMAAGGFRWFLALLTGGVVGGFPAVAYWINCGDVDLFDRLILAELIALGAVYGLMALLAAILHEDTWAVNPYTVVTAIGRSGWSYAQPCLAAGISVVISLTILTAAFEVENPALSAFLYWLFWFASAYEAMVVLRLLGLFYHHRAHQLNWFRGRTGWGV